jgi:hypothetical protein
MTSPGNESGKFRLVVHQETTLINDDDDDDDDDDPNQTAVSKAAVTVSNRAPTGK